MVIDMQEGMAKLVEKYFGHQPIIVGPETRTGMPLRIYSPEELEADRIANAVVAYHRCGGSMVVATHLYLSKFPLLPPAIYLPKLI